MEDSRGERRPNLPGVAETPDDSTLCEAIFGPVNGVHFTHPSRLRPPNLLFSGILAGEFSSIFAAISGWSSETPTEFGRFVPIHIGHSGPIRSLSGVATTTAPTVAPDEPDAPATDRMTMRVFPERGCRAIGPSLTRPARIPARRTGRVSDGSFHRRAKELGLRSEEDRTGAGSAGGSDLTLKSRRIERRPPQRDIGIGASIVAGRRRESTEW